MTRKRVCVFCASSQQVPAIYFDHTKELARHLAENSYEIQYGGGALGLMGALADEALRLGANVTGIIPHFMEEIEWGHKGLDKMIFVDTMAQRKQLMVEDVDAVIALPGGTGTFEELFEVLSNKKLGIITTPVILLNTAGFFNPLITLFHSMVENHFLRIEHLGMFTVVESPLQVCKAIETVAQWKKADAMEMAAIR